MNRSHCGWHESSWTLSLCRAAFLAVALGCVQTACLSVEAVDEEGVATLSSCDGCHGQDDSAHAAHLAGGSFAADMSCGDCHPCDEGGLPTQHFDAIVQLSFANNPLASAHDTRPTFDGLRCSDVYCHGASLGGGLNVDPVWRVTASGDRIRCGWCHGMPPRDGHPSNPSCSECHSSAFDDGALDLNHHLNGVVDFHDPTTTAP